MKKFGWLVLLVILMTACTSESDANQAAEETETNTEADEEKTEAAEDKNEAPKEKKETTDETSEDTFIESPQAPDDSELTELGATHSDQDGKIKLLAYAPEEQQVDVGPMTVTIHEAKFMHYKPSPDMIDFFHGFTHEESRFNYLKLRVTVKNTSDQQMNFAPVSYLETNTGEKKGFQDDFYLEELHGDYAPGEIRKGQLGFILEEGDQETLEKVTVNTSDVFQKEKSVEKGNSYTISFE
ncbi:DUF4352 domain-containing protein [Halobacillus mangrovi]|uniref:DUF4352 domain-containing protein n=1 Tax=Halobacillus mangrovi TaxID=402384 RepID=A0A1W5ZQX8_9BACI|nr:DUF4352 domain-containing protein [Halobacillus mangrovi]ARI75689.1 hypothetical protein HM131_02085 [Halobacillus mangrovi]